MNAVWSFLETHYQWFFSGIGVVIATAIVGLIWRRRSPPQQQQTVIGGDGHQAGRDLTVNVKKEEK